MGDHPHSNYLCPQHNCYECGRSTAESGGLLFRYVLDIYASCSTQGKILIARSSISSPSSCQICPLAFCEDCLPPGDLESVGETIPEFLLLGYGRTPQAHWIKCAGCLEHFKDHPEELATWKKEQAQIEAKARKAGLEV
jgi:SWI/SNF-related matrix-associated actin-dependent regulator of chromatin subfamily A member 5